MNLTDIQRIQESLFATPETTKEKLYDGTLREFKAPIFYIGFIDPLVIKNEQITIGIFEQVILVDKSTKEYFSDSKTPSLEAILGKKLLKQTNYSALQDRSSYSLEALKKEGYRKVSYEM